MSVGSLICSESSQLANWSSQGQWAPIVGTGIAVMGSLYLLLASDESKKANASSEASTHHCNCSHCRDIDDRRRSLRGIPGTRDPPSSRETESMDGDFNSSPQSPVESPAMQEVSTGLFTALSQSTTSPRATDVRQSLSTGGARTSNDLVPATRRHTMGSGSESKRSEKNDRGYRLKVASTLTNISNYFGTASRDRFDDSEFQHGAGRDFPEIPGEEHRNRDLRQIREQYNQPWEAERNNSAALRRHRSRTGSVAASIASARDIERIPPSRAPSPLPPPLRESQPPSTHLAHATTFPTQRPSFEGRNHPTSSSTLPTGGFTRHRDTLEVPPAVHFSHTRSNSASASSTTQITTIPTDDTSPVIVVSSDHDTSSPANEEH